MNAFGFEAPEGFLPIAAELTLASISYIALLIKSTPKHNFGFSLAYSVLKLLAICSLFVSSLTTLLGFVQVPLLLGLLLNEVVLLVASIRNKQQLNSIRIRSMYPNRILAMRIIGELLTIAVLFGVAVGTQLIVCNCRTRLNPLHLIFKVETKECEPNFTNRFIANILRPQLRGLAFAITVTASVVSISGWQYMLMGFSNNIHHKQRDNLTAILRDAPWKRAVRAVYGYLQFLVVILFISSFFVPGFSQCYEVPTIGGVDRMRYTLGATSHAFLNAILAISQMFMADVHVRLGAVKDVEDTVNGIDYSSDESEEGEQPMLAQHWHHRANSAIVQRKSMR